jgi:heptosyltransferase-2
MSDTQPQPLPAKRILVMRYRFIGDTILTVPFLRNLRRAYPLAKIDVLVGPQSGSVLEGCPYIDELITYDTTRFHKYDRGRDVRPKSILHYALELRRRQYDLVFLLKRSLSSALLAWASGARYRVGYDTEGRGLLLTHRVRWRENVHEVQSTLDVLKAANVLITDKHLEFWVSPAESACVTQIVPALETRKKKVLFHAASAHPDKLYPLGKWALLLRALSERHDIVPFFIGDKQDAETYETLQQLAAVPGVNLAGKLSLRESMALLTRLDLAICTDSGPAHLAAAANLPTIALFGPTDPVRWRPWGDQHLDIYDETLPCRPCNYNKVCENRECLTQLPPDRILNEAERMLRLVELRGGQLVKP